MSKGEFRPAEFLDAGELRKHGGRLPWEFTDWLGEGLARAVTLRASFVLGSYCARTAFVDGTKWRKLGQPIRGG